ncbi:MAG: hypothetical protein AAF558_10465 [Verrucomicrobiota bacterium]
MNPQLLSRIRSGECVRITLEEDVTFSGYIAEDPEVSEKLRMDGYIVEASGYLQQISIQLVPDDIQQIDFLTDPLEFFDQEGNSIQMKKGFFENF